MTEINKKMVTWLGEDDLHFRVTDDGKQEPVPGPSFTTWRHDDVYIKFPKDVPVLITDDPTFSPTLALRQQILRKAGANTRFKVEDVPADSPDTTNPDITIEKTLKQQNRPDDPPPELPEPPPQNGKKAAAPPAPAPNPAPRPKAKEKA